MATSSGAPVKRTRLPTLLSARSTGTMSWSALFATQAVVPSGVIAMATGKAPTATGLPTSLPDFAEMALMVPFTELVTYTVSAVRADGDAARAGALEGPTLVDVPTFPLGSFTGVTVALEVSR